MPRRIHLEPHLADAELYDRYRSAGDLVERSHWHFLWLLAGGMTAAAVASVTGYSAYWIGQMASRYNCEGPDGVGDRRHRTKPHQVVPMDGGRCCTECAPLLEAQHCCLGLHKC